ncbi:hypothetical protein EON77_03540 [bacterium]|nr:MAG: hypothetical protein EON77_03540 [bacterium]
MARVRRPLTPFGTRAFQSGDWRPAVLGAIVGLATLIGLWYAGGHGFRISLLGTLEGCVGAFFVGLLVLLIRKRHWSRRARWWTEFLGACLTGPVCILFLTLGIWPLPMHEVGTEDWSDGVAPT